jgi:hypothetical protein
VTSTATAQVPVEPPDAWDGPYNPIPPDNGTLSFGRHSCCEVAHAILIATPGTSQGKVLLFQVGGQRWMWDPASPRSVQKDALGTPPSEDLFCSCHSVDSEGRVVVHGGVRSIPWQPAPSCSQQQQTGPYCSRQPTWSYVFTPSSRTWSPEISMRIPLYHHPLPFAFENFGYYYPGSVRLHNGLVLSAGGGSSPLTWDYPSQVNNKCCDSSGNIYFVDGWQYFDPTISGWRGGPMNNQYFPGLKTTTQPMGFNYYPLLTVMPDANGEGFVFASVVTQYGSNSSNNDPMSLRAPSAMMDLSGTLGQTPWNLVSGQIDVAQSSGPPLPKNLYYPSAFLWPLQLNNQGVPTAGAPRRMVVVGGCDGNDFLSSALGAAGYGVPPYPDGGRRTNPQTYSIDSPEVPGSDWSDTLLPDPGFPRIFANTVLLPDNTVFLVGGSHFDFLAYAGHLNQYQRNHERRAAPVFVPEILDLTNPTAWVPVTAHASPRLYHSIALLLPDGRVLVGGGYRGVTPSSPQGPIYPENQTWLDWQGVHSNFEIYSPAYLSAGPRPEIVACADVLSLGSGEFEIFVDLPGSSNPVSAIGSVSLISPGSVTHHFDWDQRHVKLTFGPSPTDPTHRIRAVMPASGFTAPPGYYMLFVTTSTAGGNGTRIPSVAKFVKVQ